MLDKLDVTYQSAFSASRKLSPPSDPSEWGPLRPSTPPEMYTSTLTTPLKKMISKLTGSKLLTPSPVTRAEYISPYKEMYWSVKTKILRKQMEGMREDCILKAIFKLRTENTEMHDGIIDYFVNQYDEYSQSSEEDVSEGLKDFSKEMEYEWADQLENMDIKPATTIDPMKTSHLSNPFNKYAFLETLDLPVITELNLMGQGTPRSIESGIHTQSIVDRTAEVIQGDILANRR